MATVSIRPGQLGAFIKGSVKRNAAAVRTGIRRGLERGQSIMVRETPVDQGILKNAWKVVAGSDNVARLVNDAPHAGIVERGARPHVPPLEPILEWVKRHLAGFGIKPPRFSSRGPASEARVRKHAEAVADHEDDVLALAEAIRWKIAKNGQAPTWFVRSNLPRLRDAVVAEVDRAMKAALEAKGE